MISLIHVSNIFFITVLVIIIKDSGQLLVFWFIGQLIVIMTSTLQRGTIITSASYSGTLAVPTAPWQWLTKKHFSACNLPVLAGGV